jgi:hypothetical protein
MLMKITNAEAGPVEGACFCLFWINDCLTGEGFWLPFFCRNFELTFVNKPA